MPDSAALNDAFVDIPGACGLPMTSLVADPPYYFCDGLLN